MISLGEDLLRKVDAISNSRDESSALLLDQTKMLERQIGMDVKDIVLTQEEIEAEQRLAELLGKDTEMLRNLHAQTLKAVGRKEQYEAFVLRELEHAEQAQWRYQNMPGGVAFHSNPSNHYKNGSSKLGSTWQLWVASLAACLAAVLNCS